MSSNSSSRVKALEKIIKRLPAQMVYYGSALGAIVLAGGGQLPPGLEFVAGGIGANLLSNLVNEIARGEDVLDDEVRQRAEEAISKSDIANLLTKQDFLQGYARLIQRLDTQKAISQDILDELRTGFSAVATIEQVEELKKLLLQFMQQTLPPTLTKTRIFISYARADDEPFVEKLYHDLKDEFDIWWDRETMSNRGKTFLQEIRDAIDWSDRLILIAGPGAFTSDYVRDEWSTPAKIE
ncbi:toll/interleukin-1 receptor domain-containing protein [bacterium]|nr:toll/interleukin-1 receptor domain-containing protein [bacterium]